MIPRTVWSFWHSGTPPPLVQACLDSWQPLTQRGWRIRVLSEGDPDYAAWARNPDNAAYVFSASAQSFAALSDLVRLSFVGAHGGVWMDASVLLRDDGVALDEWVAEAEAEHAEISGYHLPSLQSNAAYPVLESWMFAAPQGSPFVAAWLAHFRHALRVGFVDYKRLVDRGVVKVDPQRIYAEHGVYLTVHVAAQAAMQARADPVTAYARLADATRGRDAPFALHAQCGWSTPCTVAAVEDVLAGRAPPSAPRIIKLRGWDANFLQWRRGRDPKFVAYAASEALHLRGLTYGTQAILAVVLVAALSVAVAVRVLRGRRRSAADNTGVVGATKRTKRGAAA